MFQLIRNNSFIILFCWCAMATALNKRMPRVIFNVKRSAYRGGGGGLNYRYYTDTVNCVVTQLNKIKKKVPTLEYLLNTRYFEKCLFHPKIVDQRPHTLNSTQTRKCAICQILNDLDFWDEPRKPVLQIFMQCTVPENHIFL